MTRIDPLRFGPVQPSVDDLEDLATFTGLNHDECRRRLETYSLTEHADAWQRLDPQSERDVHEFYKATDLYVWELMQWHATAHRLPYRLALERFASQHPPAAGYPRVLDFGCGVGTDSLFLAQRGYSVTLMDVPGVTLEFAKHRFTRRGLRATFVEVTTPLPELSGPFDAAICFDVFEHLPEPLEAARRIVGALRPDGLLIEQSTFGEQEAHPCHLGSGIERFGEGRWQVYLAGLGLRSLGTLMYRKPAAERERQIQRLRFHAWRATGLWVTCIRRA